jgi:hypothetical protein
VDSQNKIGLPTSAAMMQQQQQQQQHHHQQQAFSYIQVKQLPSLPSSSSSSASQQHHQHQQHQQLQHHVPLPASSRYLYPLPPHPDEDLSRSSSVTQHLGLDQRPHHEAAFSVSPPAVVEAMPRDQVIISQEYRTLSREDQLRASIKLKESSLI